MKLFKILVVLMGGLVVSCATSSEMVRTEAIESGTVYMVYGGTPAMYGGVEVVKTCENYQEAIDFCNKEPISDPCIIFEGTAKAPACERDSEGYPVHWGDVNL